MGLQYSDYEANFKLPRKVGKLTIEEQRVVQWISGLPFDSEGGKSASLEEVMKAFGMGRNKALFTMKCLMGEGYTEESYPGTQNPLYTLVEGPSVTLGVASK